MIDKCKQTFATCGPYHQNKGKTYKTGLKYNRHSKYIIKGYLNAIGEIKERSKRKNTAKNPRPKHMCVITGGDGRTLKFMEVAARGQPDPCVSAPSWRPIGDRRPPWEEREKASSGENFWF